MPSTQASDTALVATLVEAAARAGGIDTAITERALRLEQGRHPLVADMLAAFDDARAVDSAVASLRAGLAGFAADASDEAIAGAVDRAYRELAPSHRLWLVVTAAGLAAPAVPSLHVAGSARTRVYVFVENETRADVAFSIEVHGDGAGGRLEARRAGSLIFDLGELPAGRYLLPVLAVADGRPLTVDIEVECTQEGT
jgi:hypothetical protein